MNVLMLNGSPRSNGNTALALNEMQQVWQSCGIDSEIVQVGHQPVRGCIACNQCGMNGPCVFKDDFEFVRKHIVDADCVVFATPMYYFGISAQLKAVIDRFYAINGEIHRPKKAVLLMTYANTAVSEADPIRSHYDVLLKYLGWSDAGRVIARGVWPVGAVNRTKYPAQAYQLGKNI